MKKSFDISLYLVTDSKLNKSSLKDIVEEAVRGGVSIVQLREKELSSRLFYERAMELKKCLAPYQIPLIINDRLDIALACDAEGVHIGQSDLPYPVVRRIFGNDKIIGLSVENLKEVEQANQWEVDYIGISPVFDTQTKKDTKEAFGLEGIKKAVKISRHLTVGIGGINHENAEAVMKAGLDGIAVVSAIIASSDPKESATELRNILDNFK